MITIYPKSKYDKGISEFIKRLIPGLVSRAESIEDAKLLVNDDTKVIIDLRYLVDNINKKVNYADSEEIDNVFKYLNPVETDITPLIHSELLYLFVLPDSTVNMSQYITSSLISNLNLFHQTKFHETPDEIYQRNGNKLIGYKFNVVSNDVIQEIKRKVYD